MSPSDASISAEPLDHLVQPTAPSAAERRGLAFAVLAAALLHLLIPLGLLVFYWLSPAPAPPLQEIPIEVVVEPPPPPPPPPKPQEKPPPPPQPDDERPAYDAPSAATQEKANREFSGQEDDGARPEAGAVPERRRSPAIRAAARRPGEEGRISAAAGDEARPGGRTAGRALGFVRGSRRDASCREKSSPSQPLRRRRRRRLLRAFPCRRPTSCRNINSPMRRRNRRSPEATPTRGILRSSTE